MQIEIESHRLGLDLLEHGRYEAEWHQLKEMVGFLTEGIILEKHLEISRAALLRGKNPPVGLQTALNSVVKETLEPGMGWQGQVRLFSGSEALAGWTMDFLKNRVGVEVAFNHASYFPWIFTRLNIAGESDDVDEASRIDVGVTICSRQDLKTWGRMDPAVGVFEQVSRWLQKMRPIMPTPLVLIGLGVEGWGSSPPVFGPGWWKKPAAHPFLNP